MPTTLQIVQIILQALSSSAIAGGLIFTAVRFRQARKAQLVANFSKLVELQYGLRKIRVDHPSLHRSIRRTFRTCTPTARSRSTF